MNYTKSAFTLVEVLISVVILSLIATYLLKISVNSKENYQKITKKHEWENISTVILKRDKNSGGSNLYEQLRKDYNISSFEVRSSLKEIKYKSTKTPYSKVTIPEVEELYINIEKVNIYNKKNSSNLFSIKVGQ